MGVGLHRKCPLLSEKDKDDYNIVMAWSILVREWAKESNSNLVELIQVVRSAYGERCEALLRCAEILCPVKVQSMLSAKSAEGFFSEGAYSKLNKQESMKQRMEQMYRLLHTILKDVDRQQNLLETFGSAAHYEELTAALYASTQTICHKRSISVYISGVQQILLKLSFSNWNDETHIPRAIQAQLAWSIVTGTIAPIRISCVLDWKRQVTGIGSIVMKPKCYTLEQIPLIERYVARLLIESRKVNMQDFNAMPSQRRRLISSSMPLNLEKLSSDEYKVKYNIA